MAAKRKAWLLCVLLAILVSSSAFASFERPDTPLQVQNLDRYALLETIEAASADTTPSLHRALERAFPPPAAVATLTETRVWGSDFLKPLTHPEVTPLSRALHRASADVWRGIASDRTVLSPDPIGYRDSSNLYAYCGGDPINCSDPDGMARRTKNGGSNWFGNLGDVVNVSGTGTEILSGVLDFAGNSVSDLLALDVFADSMVVAGDSNHSAGQRVLAGAKGTAIAALDVAGGAILKRGGGLLAKIPGVAGVVEKVAASGVARAIASVASTEIASFAVVDEAAAAIRSSSIGRFLRRDVGTFLPGHLSPGQEVARLTTKAEEIHAVLPQDGWAPFRRTSGVMSTVEGSADISAGGRLNLTAAQDAFARSRGDVVARLTNRRIEILNESLGLSLPPQAHAEVTAYFEAMRRGLNPRAIGVTPAQFCPGQCSSWLPGLGADTLSPYGAYWFTPTRWSSFTPLGGVVGQ